MPTKTSILKSIKPGMKKPLEITYEEDDVRLLKALTFIDNHCQQFLKDAKKAGDYLYRGLRNSPDSIFIGKPRLERISKDTKTENHIRLNKMLKACGFKARRDNSIFCTPSSYVAKEFGDVFFIFPIDGFSYTWSTIHKDWVIEFNKLLSLYFVFDIDRHSETLKSYSKHISDHPEDYTEFNILKNRKDFITMLQFVKKFNECVYMITHGKYGKRFGPIENTMNFLRRRLPTVLAVAKKYQTLPLTRELLELNTFVNSHSFKKEAMAVIKNNGLINKRLVVAIKSMHEIYINGFYVAIIASNQNSDLIQKHFGF
jgi:hypothetical protein